jgi:hypothetical protein
LPGLGLLVSFHISTKQIGGIEKIAMTLQNIQTIRLAVGVWAAIAVAYGVSWQLSFIAPLFTTIFLIIPVWIGWKVAFQLIRRLIYSLLLGMLISEFLLDFPFICVPIYGVLFFLIYYFDTPSSPPFSTMFMTLGVTIVPIMGLSGAGLSHFIAIALLENFCIGLFFAWLFHLFIPNSLAKHVANQPPAQKAPPPPMPSKQERIENAVVSGSVALLAVVVFFSFNLVAYAFAMIQICFMVGSSNANSTVTALKANALACCVGGIAIIIVFNLLVAVPTYPFLLVIALLVLLIFSKEIFKGTKRSAIYRSGLTTFLVLLGTSTFVDKAASTNFYLRIALIIFAGLFAIAGLMLIRRIVEPYFNKSSINMESNF